MNNTFENTALFAEIARAADEHQNQQLNFRFKADDMIKLLKAIQKTPESEKLVEAAFEEALDKSDKRPMTDQLNLKAKYQKSHGLVFKDIPVSVERHHIFDAILKLGRTMDYKTGRLVFPGGCKLRSFFFPKIKHPDQQHRVCFPIFVNKSDKMFIYQWAQNQNGKIQLDVPKSANWDGVVAVELTRDSNDSDDDVESVASSVASSVRFNGMPGGMYGGNFNIPYFQNPYMPFLHNGPMMNVPSPVASLGMSPPNYPGMSANVDGLIDGMSQVSIGSASPKTESPAPAEASS